LFEDILIMNRAQTKAISQVRSLIRTGIIHTRAFPDLPAGRIDG
jgi:hypothetical protein